MDALKVWQANFEPKNAGKKVGDSGYIPPPIGECLLEHYCELGKKGVKKDRIDKLISMIESEKLTDELFAELSYVQSLKGLRRIWKEDRRQLVESLKNQEKIVVNKQVEKPNGETYWAKSREANNAFVAAFIRASCVAYQLNVGNVVRYNKVNQEPMLMWPTSTGIIWQDFINWFDWLKIQPPGFERDMQPIEREWLDRFRKELPTDYRRLSDTVLSNTNSLQHNKLLRESLLLVP